MKRTRGEKIFAVFNNIFLFLLIMLCLLPFLNIAAKSLSDSIAVAKGKVLFWPVGFSLSAYRFVVTNVQFVRSFCNTVFITVAGTALSVIVTIITAFIFTRKNMPFQKLYVMLFIFTMFFGGGIIPTYLHYYNFHLLDTYWVLILPHAVKVFHIVLLRNFYEGISPALEESARLDGASNTRILFNIYVPLSYASIATITLFVAVQIWNAYFGALMYTSKRELMPLQLYLRNMLNSISDEVQNAEPTLVRELSDESVSSASIIVATLPILCIYPFLQRYFVTGVTLGAVKE